MAFFAHSSNTGPVAPVRDHLMAVANLSEEYTAKTPWAAEARLAGLLHDLGKYGDAFRRRLEGKESGVDHWSAGAWLALRMRCAGAALAIQGHHIGLQHLDLQSLARLDPRELTKHHPFGLRLSAESLDDLQARFKADGLGLPDAEHPMLGRSLSSTVPVMLDVRCLFSALVDADFLDTEARNQDERG